MYYLLRLTSQLSEGLQQVSAEQRQLSRAYLQARQNEDGGFSGRAGGSDLYYTGFALRGLAMLEGLSDELVQRASGYLRHSLQSSVSVIDFFSLLYASLLLQMHGGARVLADAPTDWQERVANVLEALRTSDGGYAKAAGGKSSTYHTFLVGLCYEMLGKPYPQPEEVLRFVASRQRDDGGYVELTPMRRSGTNPTAAAVGIHQLIAREAFDPAPLQQVVDFLAEMQSLEGGLRANTVVPMADVLSTFTGAWTLAQLGALARVNAEEIYSFIESVAQADGSFRGGLLDDASDVEYTFYGLGVLALIGP